MTKFRLGSPARVTRVKRVLIILLLSAAVGAALGAQPTEPNKGSSDSWPGWRGQDGSGRSSVSLPVDWSAERNVRWRAAIPGHGYSSPIVVGDVVYVTTAIPSLSGQALEASLRWTEIVLLWLLVITSIPTVISFIRPPCHQLRDFVPPVFIATLVCFVIAMVLIGPELMDFRRCTIRGWIASTGVMTMCLALAASGRRHMSAGRGAALAVCAVGLGALVFGGFPAKDHAFRGGLTSINSQIAIASCVIPVIVTLGLLAVRLGGPRVRRRIAWAFVSLSIPAVALLIQMLVARESTFDAAVSEGPLVSLPWLTGAVCGIVLLMVAVWNRRRSLVERAMFVGAATIAAVLVPLVALLTVAIWSPYLRYQIGTPQMAVSLSSWTALWSLAGAVALGGLWQWCQRIRGSVRIPSLSSSAIATVALLIGSVFFFRVNYLKVMPELTRAIVAIDRQSGTLLWTAEGFVGPHTAVDGRNSAATPTPVSDGARVCAYFGDGGLMCTGTDGRRLWSRGDLAGQGYYGTGTSLALVDGRVVVMQYISTKAVRMTAVSVESGVTVWSRDLSGSGFASGYHRTPVVARHGVDPQVLYWGFDGIRALSAASGADIWVFLRDSAEDEVASLMVDQSHLYLVDGSGALSLDMSRAVEGNPVRWTAPVRANCSSPALCANLLFTITDSGILAALDAQTGELAWRQRLSGRYLSSPIASPDAVYFTNEAGATTVVACERAYRAIATNDLGEDTAASPAAADGDLYLRTDRYLYRVGR